MTRSAASPVPAGFAERSTMARIRVSTAARTRATAPPALAPTTPRRPGSTPSTPCSAPMAASRSSTCCSGVLSACVPSLSPCPVKSKSRAAKPAAWSPSATARLRGLAFPLPHPCAKTITG